jgi:GDP-4-dehydro-6-deoxy-D-mannose reductase
MRYLVTGAGGFAGRHLVRHLMEAGHQVTGLVRQAGSLGEAPAAEVVADLNKRPETARAVAAAKPEGIFHLAAGEVSVGRSWEDPAQTLTDNLATTVNLFEAARQLEPPPRVLFVSSADVLGSVPETDQPIAESRAADPVSPYGLSKFLGEQAAAYYTEHLNVPILVVRAFNHTGSGQNPRFVLPSFAKQIADLEPKGGQLKTGNLDVRRDFSDVRDIVRAYATLMADGKAGQTYHAGAGQAWSIRELLGLLAGMSTATIEIVTDPRRLRPDEPKLLVADTAKLRALGWQPEIPIAQTLTDILAEARNKEKT